MGRRKGSKNKPKDVPVSKPVVVEEVVTEEQPKKRGRRSDKEIGREARKKVVYEPSQLSKENYRHDLMQALVWHDHNSSEEQLKNYTITFVRNTLGDPTLAEQLNKLPEYDFGTLGKICRLMDLGADLQPREVNHLTNHIARLKEKINLDRIEKPKTKITVQDRLRKKASEICAEIDVNYDAQFLRGNSPVLNLEHLFKKAAEKEPLAPQVLTFIQGQYQKELNELNSVKTDKEIKEAYSSTKPAALKRAIAFCEMVVSSCESFKKDHKGTSVKVRKSRPKPPAKVVAKMKYLFKDDKLGLQSINPTKVVDSEEVWVYDVQKRFLTVYRAQAGKVLTVKGTTFLNFDIDTSETKKIRKPEVFFIGVVDWSKRPITKAFDAIRGKTKKPRGRMNAQTLIVKVF